MDLSVAGILLLNSENAPTGAIAFQVRFGPEAATAWNQAWSNNLGLTHAGVAEVTAEFVRLSDSRNAQPEALRTFAMADIVNVSFAEAGNIVTLRTRDEKREAWLWMASAADAQALLRLLPKSTTPEFVEYLRQHQEYRQRLVAIAPKVRVTPVIIALNVAVFLLMALAGAGLSEVNPLVHLRFGSNFGPLTWTGEPWRLLTSAFIHFGVVHIALNMLALYNGGPFTEKLYGSARFAVIYLLAALSGSVVSSWWDPLRNSAGASGAVFGVFGALLAYIARFPRAIPLDILKSVRSGALLLCVYSLGFGVVVNFFGRFTNVYVDNSAHVGGLLGGVVSGYLLARPFEPGARAIPRPGTVAAVAAVVCMALALLSYRLWR